MIFLRLVEPGDEGEPTRTGIRMFLSSAHISSVGFMEKEGVDKHRVVITMSNGDIFHTFENVADLMMKINADKENKS